MKHRLKVVRSPIARQSHWLESPLNIILDMLKAILAACASCSGEYWPPLWELKEAGQLGNFLFLCSDSEPHYSNLTYDGCYVYRIPTHATSASDWCAN